VVLTGGLAATMLLPAVGTMLAGAPILVDHGRMQMRQWPEEGVTNGLTLFLQTFFDPLCSAITPRAEPINIDPIESEGPSK